MQLASIIIAALSLLITMTTFLIDKYLSRKQRTIEALNKLKDIYHEEIGGKENRKKEGYYRTLVKYFSRIESFSSGVLSRYYDFRTVKRDGSKFIIRLYDDNKEYLIDQRRKQFRDAAYYSNLEKLALRLEKNNTTEE